MSDQQPPSPCIAVCKLETDQFGIEICKGCYRTIDEIVQWSRMSASEKNNVLERIKRAKASPLTK
ncbi:DUF1289 domain-containing protein [Pleionea sediminis]|uniref:DUF1289 domain-containing protein n=1 Tax=Pleionea sediminis TaxID=2569479 RepID=UPI0011863E53|nr:DUF1289 domain-containing protein [Pleionea sediminis]